MRLEGTSCLLLYKYMFLYRTTCSNPKLLPDISRLEMMVKQAEFTMDTWFRPALHSTESLVQDSKVKYTRMTTLKWNHCDVTDQKENELFDQARLMTLNNFRTKRIYKPTNTYVTRKGCCPCWLRKQIEPHLVPGRTPSRSLWRKNPWEWCWWATVTISKSWKPYYWNWLRKYWWTPSEKIDCTCCFSWR